MDALAPAALPLAIVYEDDDLLVIDKPAGLVVHPAPGHPGGTLVNAVLHHCPDLEGVGGEQRPGIVHRLDKETSGLIVVAKHDQAHRYLQAQFKARTVYKEYLALLEGRLTPAQGRISAPLGRHPTDRKRQAVLPADPVTGVAAGREAVTEYQVLALYQWRGGWQQHCHGHFHPRARRAAHGAHPPDSRPFCLAEASGGGRIPSTATAHRACPWRAIFSMPIACACACPTTGEEREFVAPLPAELEASVGPADLIGRLSVKTLRGAVL